MTIGNFQMEILVVERGVPMDRVATIYWGNYQLLKRETNIFGRRGVLYEVDEFFLMPHM